jgi:hypothetical protein
VNAATAVDALRDPRVAARAAAARAAAREAAAREALRRARRASAARIDAGSSIAPQLPATLRTGGAAALAPCDDHAARAEKLILEHCAAQIAASAGTGAMVFELGSGLGANTHVLLSALVAPAACTSIDLASAPLPMRADAPCGRTVVVVPGAALAVAPTVAGALLRRVGVWAGADALLVAGAVPCSARDHLPRFTVLALAAGWAHCQYWADGQAHYALHVLERMG